MQLAVSGWGVTSEIANYVADDVIVGVKGKRAEIVMIKKFA